MRVLLFQCVPDLEDFISKLPIKQAVFEPECLLVSQHLAQAYLSISDNAGVIVNVKGEMKGRPREFMANLSHF